MRAMSRFEIARTGGQNQHRKMPLSAWGRNTPFASGRPGTPCRLFVFPLRLRGQQNPETENSERGSKRNVEQCQEREDDGQHAGPRFVPQQSALPIYSRSDCAGNKTQRLKIPSAVPNGMLSNARNERTMVSMRAQGSCRSSPHPAKNSTAAFTKMAIPIKVKSELRKPLGICGGAPISCRCANRVLARRHITRPPTALSAESASHRMPNNRMCSCTRLGNE